MSIVHLTGISSSSPSTTFRRITINYPGLNSVELLCMVDGSPGYQIDLDQLLLSDRRSSYGGLVVQGDNRRDAQTYTLSSDCNYYQKEQLRVIKLRQDKSFLTTPQPVTIEDRFNKVTYDSSTMAAPTWLSGFPVTGLLGFPEGCIAYSAFLEFGDGWATIKNPSQKTAQESYWVVQFKVKVLI